MYRGRYQLGQEIPLTVLTVNGSGTPTAPTEAPFYEVHNTSGKVKSGKFMPVLDRFGVTGLFQANVRLDTDFSPGRYTVVYRWLAGSFQGVEYSSFEVVAGGDADGAVIAAFWYERPHADFLVQQLDSGKLVRGKNPRL